jgi:hypothetical protein
MPRRRFQFRLPSLFALTTVAAFGCSLGPPAFQQLLGMLFPRPKGVFSAVKPPDYAMGWIRKEIGRREARLTTAGVGPGRSQTEDELQVLKRALQILEASRK